MKSLYYEGVVELVLQDVTKGRKKGKYVLEKEVSDFLLNQVAPPKVRQVFRSHQDEEFTGEDTSSSEDMSDDEEVWGSDAYVDDYGFEINSQRTW